MLNYGDKMYAPTNLVLASLQNPGWQAVCNKCCIDTYELNTGEDVWLCKICSESREVLKKTNMWTQFCPQGIEINANSLQ